MNIYLLERDADYDEWESFVVSAESETSAHWVVIHHMIRDQATWYSDWGTLADAVHGWLWSYIGNVPDGVMRYRYSEIKVRRLGTSESATPRVEVSAFRPG